MSDPAESAAPIQVLIPTIAALRLRAARAEAAAILRALRRARWRLPAAADLLGVATSSLQHIVETRPELRAARDHARPPAERRGGRPRA